jgi:hypothetical protein
MSHEVKVDVRRSGRRVEAEAIVGSAAKKPTRP